MVAKWAILPNSLIRERALPGSFSLVLVVKACELSAMAGVGQIGVHIAAVVVVLSMRLGPDQPCSAKPRKIERTCLVCYGNFGYFFFLIFCNVEDDIFFFRGGVCSE